MQNLLIIGNSITADLLYKYLLNDDRYQVHAFSVDGQYIEDESIFGRPVIELEKLKDNYSPSDFSILIAMGYGNLNRNRENMFSRLKKMGYEVITYIHPDAKVYSNNIGEGSIIMPNAFIDVYSEIGTNSVVWGNCSVAHHAKIGNNCWLATGCVMSAGVKVGDNGFIGVSATVVNDVSIGKYNIVGAGTLIVKKTNDYEVYISRQTEKFRLSAEDYLRFAKL